MAPKTAINNARQHEKLQRQKRKTFALNTITICLIIFLCLWTVSLFGSPIQSGLVRDTYAPVLNFIALELVSPLNGQILWMTLDSLRYCISNSSRPNMDLSSLSIFADGGNGTSVKRIADGGLFGWVARKLVESQTPEPALLRYGCWDWETITFEKMNHGVLLAFQILQFLTFGLCIIAIAWAFYLIFDQTSCNMEDKNGNGNLANSLGRTRQSKCTIADKQRLRRYTTRFTWFVLSIFILAGSCLVIKTLFMFTIANSAGINLAHTAAAPYINPKSANKPPEVAYAYVISERIVGSSFIVSLLSCILLFVLSNYIIFSILPSSTLTNGADLECDTVARRSILRASSSTSTLNSSRSTLHDINRCASDSNLFKASPYALNQDLPALSNIYGKTAAPETPGVPSRWAGFKISLIRLVKRVSGNSLSSEEQEPPIRQKKKVRIVDPNDSDDPYV